MPVSGSNAELSQFDPPVEEGKDRSPRVPSGASCRDGGEYMEGLSLKPSTDSSAKAFISGVQSIMSASVKPCLSKGAGRVGNG